MLTKNAYAEIIKMILRFGYYFNLVLLYLTLKANYKWAKWAKNKDAYLRQGGRTIY